MNIDLDDGEDGSRKGTRVVTHCLRVVCPTFDSVPLSARARERYADLTPEEYERRRTRGWELVSMTGI